jgi:hypothetical protein
MEVEGKVLEEHHILEDLVVENQEVAVGNQEAQGNERKMSFSQIFMI